MKFNTFARYPFEAEYWGYTIDPEDINQVKVYSFFRNVPVQMIADGSGRIFLYTRDGEILKAGQIRKITRIRDGVVFIKRTYEISVQEPQISFLDTDVTYKYWALEVV